MHKYEQKFCSELNKWLIYNGEKVIGKSCPIECKVGIEDKPINFKSGFRPHQVPTLIHVKQKVHAYKVSDMDQMPKPYDIAFFCKAPSLIAIMWIRKGNKTFYLIDPIAIQGLIDDGHKSIDEKMAHLIADYVGEVK